MNPPKDKTTRGPCKLPARCTAALALLGVMTVLAGAVPSFSEVVPESQAAKTSSTEPQPSEHRPGGDEVFRGMLTDSVGPYSIFMAAATAGIHQATDNPPDWRQGFLPLSERFGSNMGITAIGNSVRYGTGWAMNADFRFRKCECRGLAPRIGHAVKATALARRRGDGAAVPSLPNLLAPYAATTSAVYAWYPSRYGIKDAFRMGNYNLLGTLTSNIVWEFMPEKALKFLHRFHLSGSH